MTITEPATHPLDTEPVRRDRLVQREVSFTWTLGTGANHYGEPCTVVARLSCDHFASRKTFVATLRQMMRWDNVEAGMVMEYVTVLRSPAARYSAGALTKFADDALAALLARRDEDTIARYFTIGSAA